MIPLTRPVRTLPDALWQALVAAFGDRASQSLAQRTAHGRDESAFSIEPPAAVVYAESTADVQILMRLAHTWHCPVIPFGVGSSLEGHLLAIEGGISLDVSRMNAIIAIHPEDMTVTIQPGVTRMALQQALRSYGLFFPIDPGADASLGGMCATRASGTNAVRYGTMRDNVMALEVVRADGEILHCGSRAKKSSAGYDLTRLLVGSEGTLGIITEITLKLYPLPESVAAATCSFPTLEQAVRTVMTTIQMGVPIARCELLGSESVRACNRYSHLDLPEKPLLLLEFHGTPNEVQTQTETVQTIAQEFEGQGFAWATTPEDRTRLWTARHHAFFAALQTRPGCKAITTDVCVPISRLAECLLTALADVEVTGLPYFLVGHVGDGNFHMGYLIDPHDDKERDQAERLNRSMVEHALRLGGTCSGEHGVGMHKMAFLQQEVGDTALHTMQLIKRALDPRNLLNPGKIVPWV